MITTIGSVADSIKWGEKFKSGAKDLEPTRNLKPIAKT